MIKKTKFGNTSVGEATLYTIENKNHMKIGVTDFGATLVNVLVPDKDSNPVDVVLGCDSAMEYEERIGSYWGATVGRVANRISNASFDLNGVHYQLTNNDHGNCLHGGKDFYNGRMWIAMLEDNDQCVTFSIFSPDGDQGFPGDVDISVTYELTDDNEVKITYHAVPAKDTIINMTNHSFFNLNGHASGNVLDQKVWIDADAYTENDATSCPTGKIIDVTGTPMDFRIEKKIGQDIEADYEALHIGNGYDHNYVLNHQGSYRKVASMYSELSGIKMEVYTDLPGIQLYTANFLDGQVSGKDGICYKKRDAACFETQYFPDAIHQEAFEGPVCIAEEAYHTVTAYKFSV